MQNKITSYFLNNENKYEFELKENNSYLFEVQDDSKIIIDFRISGEEITLNFNVGNNSTVDLRFLLEKKFATLKLKSNVLRGSIFNAYIADFSENNLNFNSVVDLNGENASSTFKLGILAKKDCIKNYGISFNHITGKTISLLEANGVTKDISKIKINGVSHIYKDSIKANATQKAKVIVFDKEANAIANPILKIDCNDVIAKHACAIGSLKDEHVYYLLSRGLTLEEAKNLITLGYLIPISKYFENKDAENIKKLIEGEF